MTPAGAVNVGAAYLQIIPSAKGFARTASRNDLTSTARAGTCSTSRRSRALCASVALMPVMSLGHGAGDALSASPVIWLNGKVSLNSFTIVAA